MSLAFLGFFLRDREGRALSAAMEAAINEYYEHPDFTLASRAAYVTARNIFEHGLAPGELLNVNVPALGVDAFDGFEVTRMGKRIYQDELIERLDPRGLPYYWIGGPPPSGLAEPGTDFHAVVNHRVAITPIQLDLTASRLLARLASWPWEMPPLEVPVISPAAEPTSAEDARQDEAVTAQADPIADRR